MNLHKSLGNSWLTEQLLATQEGIFSIYLAAMIENMLMFS
jgi:hypothetical protein